MSMIVLRINISPSWNRPVIADLLPSKFWMDNRIKSNFRLFFCKKITLFLELQITICIIIYVAAYIRHLTIKGVN